MRERSWCSDMGLVQLKIRKDSRYIQAIKAVKDFDPLLSIGGIKKQIENDDFVVRFDFYRYDLLDEINNVDKKADFRLLISKLLDIGAEIEIYKDDEKISLALLDHWILLQNEIQLQTEKDIARELGECAFKDEDSVCPDKRRGGAALSTPANL